MKLRGFPLALCALALLAGCSAPQAPAPATSEPPESTTPAAEYERCRLEDIGATLLLPASWAGQYVIEAIPGSEDSFRLAQKDYLSGEWGVREDGTEGPIPDPDGAHVTLATFSVDDAAELDIDPAALTGTGEDGLFLWLGERDGRCYTLRFPTSFSAGDPVDAEAKYQLYQQLSADLRAYPRNASDYLLFDSP